MLQRRVAAEDLGRKQWVRVRYWRAKIHSATLVVKTNGSQRHTGAVKLIYISDERRVLPHPTKRTTLGIPSKEILEVFELRKIPIMHRPP
jgi:hypothetical protein